MSCILTKAQLERLLRIYADEGSVAARAIAPELGIRPAYVKKLAVLHHVRVKPRQPKRRYRNPWNDPRWERAKRIGVIVI